MSGDSNATLPQTIPASLNKSSPRPQNLRIRQMSFMCITSPATTRAPPASGSLTLVERLTGLPVMTSLKVEQGAATTLSSAGLRGLRVLIHRSAIDTHYFPDPHKMASRACEALSENPQYPQTRNFHLNPMQGHGAWCDMCGYWFAGIGSAAEGTDKLCFGHLTSLLSALGSRAHPRVQYGLAS
jgi:hypothetical protein